MFVEKLLAQNLKPLVGRFWFWNEIFEIKYLNVPGTYPARGSRNWYAGFDSEIKFLAIFKDDFLHPWAISNIWVMSRDKM